MIGKSLLRDFASLSLLCIVALLLVNFPQLFDPFVRHDDYPALLGWREIAYDKALDEGRWLNYWWQFRPVLWSAPVNYFLFLAACSLFAGAVPLAVLDSSVGNWYKGYLALFVTFSIPTFVISHWFNTLLPGMWIVTFYALAIVFLPHRSALALLVPAVPLTLMAYTTYPLILLTLILLSQKAPKGVRGLVISLSVFFFSLAFGLLLIYSLNYYYHDVFGIPIAEWRGPTQAETTSDLLLNIAKIKSAYRDSLIRLGGGSPIYGAILLVLFLVVWTALLFRQSFLAIIILVAAMAGIVPLVLQSFMSGVRVPLRAVSWLWILFGFTLTSLAIQLLQARGFWVSATRVAMISVLPLQVMFIAKISLWQIPIWQRTTREIAEAVPNTTGNIYVYGSYVGLKGAQTIGIQYSSALRLRLTYLTGAKVVLCGEMSEKCQGIFPLFDAAGWATIPIIETLDQNVVILLPRPNVGP